VTGLQIWILMHVLGMFLAVIIDFLFLKVVLILCFISSRSVFSWLTLKYPHTKKHGHYEQIGNRSHCWRSEERSLSKWWAVQHRQGVWGRSKWQHETKKSLSWKLVSSEPFYANNGPLIPKITTLVGSAVVRWNGKSDNANWLASQCWSRVTIIKNFVILC